MHPTTGDIKTFPSQEEADTEGYTIALNAKMLDLMQQMSPENRLAYIHEYEVKAAERGERPHPDGNRKTRRARRKNR